jgi:hypothetical protein
MSAALLRLSSSRATTAATTSYAIGGCSVRFATKMAGGSTQNGRDSIGKRLGIKKFGGSDLSF